MLVAGRGLRDFSGCAPTRRNIEAISADTDRFLPGQLRWNSEQFRSRSPHISCRVWPRVKITRSMWSTVLGRIRPASCHIWRTPDKSSPRIGRTLVQDASNEARRAGPSWGPSICPHRRHVSVCCPTFDAPLYPGMCPTRPPCMRCSLRQRCRRWQRCPPTPGPPAASSPSSSRAQLGQRERERC